MKLTIRKSNADANEENNRVIVMRGWVLTIKVASTVVAIEKTAPKLSLV
ncbi:hypothetical protein [Levilactobacillus andaensis]|nr:hypothetical protein [Levilactobacillus andaensis]